MILFRCKCGKVMKTQPSHAGKGIRCPECMSIIRVPDTEPVKAALVGDRPLAPVPPPAAIAPAIHKSSFAAAARHSSPRKKTAVQPVGTDFDEPESFAEVDELSLDYAEELSSEDFDSSTDNEDVEDYAEEIPDYEPAALPGRRKKKKKKPLYEEKVKAPPTADESVSPKLMNALYGLSGIFVAGILGLIGWSIMNAGAANAEFYELPTKFEKWRHASKHLTCEVPSMVCWELKESGGTAGMPPKLTLRNDYQSVRITVHGSLSGTAMAMMAKAGGGLQTKDGEEIPEDLSTIGAMHRYQHMKITAEYSTYEETEPENIDTGFGEARVSQFSASSPLGSEYGLRATLISSEFLYNVLCKCPKDRVEEYKPIFKMMIESIGR